jgi:hypothetical protein
MKHRTFLLRLEPKVYFSQRTQSMRQNLFWKGMDPSLHSDKRKWSGIFFVPPHLF